MIKKRISIELRLASESLCCPILSCASVRLAALSVPPVLSAVFLSAALALLLLVSSLASVSYLPAAPVLTAPSEISGRRISKISGRRVRRKSGRKFCTMQEQKVWKIWVWKLWEINCRNMRTIRAREACKERGRNWSKAGVDIH